MRQLLRFPALLSLLLFALPAAAQDWVGVTRNGGQYEEQSRGLAVDAAGNTYIAGFFVEQTNFGTGNITAYGGDGADIYLAKYSPTGTLLWFKRAGGVEDDFAYDIAVDAAGNSYVIGHFQQTATFGTLTVTSAGVYDVFVAKYNTSGDPQWVQRYGGLSSDLGYSIALDPSGNLFISGNYMATTTFGSTSMTSAGGYDAFIAKLDASGNTLWAKTGGGLLNENANQVTSDASGNCLVTGNFMHTSTFDGQSVTSAGNGDIFVAKYSATGVIQWLKRAGNFREDNGYGIATDATGNVYVSGFYQEPVNFEGIQLTNSGFYDIFLAKFSPTGVIEWVERAGGSLYDNSWGLLVEPSGSVLMTGYFQGTATFGSFTLNSNGAQDIYVARYSSTGTALWAKSAGGSQYDNSFSIAQAPNGNAHITGFFSTTATFTPFSVTSAGLYDSYVARLSPGCGVSANAGPNQNVCTGATVTLGTASQSGYTYSWSVSPAIPGFASSAADPTVTLPSVTATTQYTFTLTATAGTCPPATDDAVITVSPVPVVAVTPGAPAICAGSSVTLSASGADAYTWSPVTGLNNNTGSVVIASPASTTTYSVNGSLAGCAGAPVGVTVTVNAIPAAPVATNTGPACPGTTVNLSANTIAGATYSWVGPNNFTSSAQNPVVNAVTSASGGTYAVYAIVNGCTSAPGTTNLIVHPSPLAPTAGSNSPVCAGAPINLQASAVSGATYSWVGPNTFASTNQNPSLAGATAAMAGVYTVYSVSANGCASAMATTTVSVTPLPLVATFGNTTLCEGQNLNLSAASGPGAAFSWAGPNNASSTSATLTVAGALPGSSGNYTVFVTANGCTAQQAVPVTINPLPAAPVASSNGPVCEGSLLQLSASTVANTSYSWAGPDNFTSTQQNPAISAAALAQGGIYTVYSIDTGTSCVSNPATVSVTVVPTPVADASNNSPLCEGNSLNLFAATAGTGSATYNWTGPNNFTSTDQNPSFANATVALSGTYILTVTENNCSSTDTTVVSVNNVPFAPAIFNNTPVCVGGTISLSTNAVSGATYSWTGPGGFAFSGQNVQIPNATTADAGTYTLEILVTGACTYLPAYATVEVNAPPVQPTATSTSPVCVGQPLELIASPAGLPAYSWTGPGGFNNTNQQVTIQSATAADAGNYTVFTLVPGCAPASAVVTATVNPLPMVDAASSPFAVCAGTAVQLTATGADTYVWTPAADLNNPNIANPIFTGSSTTQLTVTGTDQNGCSASDTTTVLITPLPVVTVTASADTIGTGGTVQLSTTATGVGPFTYAWTPAGGLSSTTIANPTASPSASTTYQVLVTDVGTGCTSTASISIVISADEDELAALGMQVSVYPNPFSSAFSAVITAEHEEEVTLLLHDMSGRLVSTRKVLALPGENTVQFNLGASVSDGVYLLSVQTQKRQQHTRLVKGAR